MDGYRQVFIVSFSLLHKILNACQNKIHGNVAYTFFNVCEKITSFCRALKKMDAKENWFPFPASLCITLPAVRRRWQPSVGRDRTCFPRSRPEDSVSRVVDAAPPGCPSARSRPHRRRTRGDLNPGPSAPESSTLTTRLPHHPNFAVPGAKELF